MPNFSEPVSISFIAATIAVIFIIVGVGVLLVKLKKKSVHTS
jgi:hypothetical protein